MKNQKGFTLIELLIVIAIIGLLAALALVSLTAAQQRARDTKRVADMKSFQTSLELYYNENAAYPVLGDDASDDTDTWEELAEDMSAYISSLSTPPSDNAADDYVYLTNNSDRYYIAATNIEDASHQVLGQDIDGTVGGAGWVKITTDASSYDETAAGVTQDCDDTVYCLAGSASQ